MRRRRKQIRISLRSDFPVLVGFPDPAYRQTALSTLAKFTNLATSDGARLIVDFTINLIFSLKPANWSEKKKKDQN